MATIPMGNFGQTIATPQRGVQIAETGRAARAMQQLGQVGAEVATQQMTAQTRLDEMQRRKDEEAAERAAQTDAARVRTTKINQLSEAMDVLNQEVVAGKVDKTKAEEEWQHRAGEILRDATSGLDQRFAGAVQVELDGMTQRGMAGVRRAVTKRNQDDVQANLMTLGEEYQRMAIKDRPRAMAEYFASLDAMAPDAGWAPDQVAKVKQQFREGTAFTQAFTMVRDASRDLGAVRKAREALGGEAFADIDPQRRAALDAQLDGYETNILQRQEIAAQRAARQAEARLREAGAAFQTAQTLIDSGVPLAPQEYERLATLTAGTPYAPGLKAMQEQARAVGGFAAQPIAAQRAALDQVNARIAQQGASEALVKRRDALEKVVGASTKDAAEDPLRAGLQRGIIEQIAPLDISTIDGFTKTVGQRLAQAQVVQAWSGKPVSPLTTEEAERFGTMLSTLPVPQRASALVAISTQIGQQAAAGLAAQIDKKDKALSLALQYGAKKTTAGRYTAELILNGQQALKDKTAKIDAAAESGWRATIAQEIGDAYPNQMQAENAKEASMLIAAGLAAEGSTDVRRAVRLAAGGEIVEFNGRRVPLPAGMEHGDLENRVRSIKPADLAGQAPGGKVLVGGQPVSLEQFTAALPDAQLIYAGNGRYSVLGGGRVVTNANGAPIFIKARP